MGSQKHTEFCVIFKATVSLNELSKVSRKAVETASAHFLRVLVLRVDTTISRITKRISETGKIHHLCAQFLHLFRYCKIATYCTLDLDWVILLSGSFRESQYKGLS